MNQRSLRLEQASCNGLRLPAGYPHNANTTATEGCSYRDDRVIGWDNFLKPLAHSDVNTPTI
jgi:hypothetical protein